MGRNNSRERPTKRIVKDTGKRIKKKPCALCIDKVEQISYKDLALLRRYVSDRGKIRSRRVSGNCSQHQRQLALVIKTARELALLPYLQRTVSEKVTGRGPGRSDRSYEERDTGATLGIDKYADFPDVDSGELADEIGDIETTTAALVPDEPTVLVEAEVPFVIPAVSDEVALASVPSGEGDPGEE